MANWGGSSILVSCRADRLHKVLRYVVGDRLVRFIEGYLAQGGHPLIGLEIRPAFPAHAKVEIKDHALPPRKRVFKVIDDEAL